VKKFFPITAIALLVAAMPGCGKIGEEIDPANIAYLTEFKEIDLGSSYINSIAARKRFRARRSPPDD
jgi:hypothetical protein